MSKKVIENKWIFSPKEISDLFGHTVDGFRKRTQMPDFPEGCKVGHGKYDLKVYLRWCLGRFSVDASKMGLAETKLERERKKLEKETIEVETLKKNLLPKEEVVQGLSIVLVGTRQRLLSWFKTLPPYLIGRSEKEMMVVLRQETRALLTDMSKGIAHIMPKKTKKRSRKK